jgi:hypothetical protein
MLLPPFLLKGQRILRTNFYAHRITVAGIAYVRFLFPDPYDAFGAFFCAGTAADANLVIHQNFVIHGDGSGGTIFKTDSA